MQSADVSSVRSTPSKSPRKDARRHLRRQLKRDLFYEFARWGWDAKGWSLATRTTYGNHCKLGDVWLESHRDVSIFCASFLDLREFLYTKNTTARHRNNTRQALVGLGEFLVDTERWTFNPAYALPRLREPINIPKALELDEAQRILRAAQALGPQYHVLIGTLLYTGLRREEARTLTWDDLGPDMQWIRFRGKRDKERVIPIHPDLAQILRPWRYASSSPWLFPSPRSPERPMSAGTLRCLVKEAGDFAGIVGLHPHVLRHTFATCLLETGANLRTVQEALGHSNPQTTVIYTKVRPSGLREAFGALDFRKNTDDLGEVVED